MHYMQALYQIRKQLHHSECLVFDILLSLDYLCHVTFHKLLQKFTSAKRILNFLLFRLWKLSYIYNKPLFTQEQLTKINSDVFSSYFRQICLLSDSLGLFLNTTKPRGCQGKTAVSNVGIYICDMWPPMCHKNQADF